MPLSELLKSLWLHISKKRKLQFAFLILLMIVASLTEVISIGAIVPFLGVLMNPEKIYQFPIIQNIAYRLNIYDSEGIVFPLTIAFGIFTVLAGAMRLILLYVSTRLSFATGSDLSIGMYRKTLYQPYKVHMNRNSSEVIDAVATKANGIIYNTITPFLMLVSSSVMLAIILIAIIWFQPEIAISIFLGFGTIYLFIVLLTKNTLLNSSEKMARYSTKSIKYLQEGLGGIRDILIDGSQEMHCGIYIKNDNALRQAQGSVHFISHSPRYAIETLGIVLILILVYANTRDPSVEMAEIIPILGALALCAQRLLPLLQQSYLGWTTIRGGQFTLSDTLELLNQEMPTHIDSLQDECLKFNHSITLSDLSFEYGLPGQTILNKINFSINKGGRVGIVGKTGSGKSTLLDILMGLLLPSSGEMSIDGRPLNLGNMRSWQKKIAHVPQSIYLSDSTIAENIAFGVPRDQIDIKKVIIASQLAQINSTIEMLPLKYATLVGERGVRLSGGQRQRIGIARALYKEADVLILDEATSALDEVTEEMVMKSIIEFNQNMTIFIVAHRLTTLKNCSEIIELGLGDIQWAGSYQEMIERIKG